MEHSVNFDFTGRYHTIGNPDTSESMWIVLHGYGQLARYFIRKFEAVSAKGVFVVAPEALSRFYLSDVSTPEGHAKARVGASWMTRENRLTDIENYLAFLEAVYRKEKRTNMRNVTLLGFSQGAATATRWAANSPKHFDRLILWAGILPPDLGTDGQERLRTLRLSVVYGTSDPYLNDARFEQMKQMTAVAGIVAETITFEGGHEIDQAVLDKLL